MNSVNATVVYADTASATGNVLPLLHEIKHAIEQLLGDDKETVLDLRRMPLTPAEEKQLEAFLGVGEVKAEMNALGRSLFQETQYSGVWIVTHYNNQEDIMGRFITVTRAPDILFAQTADVETGLINLTERLNENETD